MGTNDIGFAWWILFAFNVGLTFFLLWRNFTLRKKYYDLEDELRAEYNKRSYERLKRWEKETMEAIDVRKNYEELIAEHKAGFIPEGD